MRAVDSEHAKNINADAWRQHQLLKHTANRGHPFARFATGNYDTLLAAPRARGADCRGAFEAFYKRHYSANLMRLAVVGPQVGGMEGL